MNASRGRLFLGLLSVGLGGLFLGLRPAALSAVPAAWTQDLQVRLNGVSLAILAYLQTHRSSYLETVKAEGQAATALLRRFTAESQGTPPELVARIETAYENQRQGVAAVLKADAAQQEARDHVLQAQALLLQWLEKKLSAGTHAAAWKGPDRSRWLLTALAEVKGFSPETPGPLAAAQSVIFHEALAKYRRETPARQAAAIDDAQKYWEACVAGALAITDAENTKRAELVKFTQARADLDLALDDYRRAPPAVLLRAHRRLLSTANLPYAGGLVCWLFALGLVSPFFRRQQTVDLKSIQRLTDCVEAAAAGDLSRLSQVSADAGLERLAYGLIRLSAVLVRSENLVYHLAALVEASGDAIVSQNLEGKILSWNKGAQRIYGYSVDEVRGQSIGILSPMDEGSQLRAIVENVKAGEKASPFEALHQAKNGRLVRAFVKVSAIHDSLHQVIGVSFCAQELSAASADTLSPDRLASA